MDNNQILTAVLFAIAIVFFYRNWKMSQIAAQHIQAGKQFLEQNGKKDNVITTTSGLQYEVLESGTGDTHPQPSSKVKVHYHGTLIDGTVFDSSVNRGQPIEFAVKQVIKGWQEGLQLMVKGQKIRLYVPYQLAYGKRGIGKIPAGSLLIFDVELLDVM